VTTHLGDLKTYAFHNDSAENGAVEFDVETLRPTYKLFIGQYGMSNALRIAKRLNLPKDVLKRAHKYLRRKKGKTGDLARLQQLREEAEKAKLAALEAEHAAAKQREEFEQKTSTLEREAKAAAELADWRNGLSAGTNVQVTRFDKVGRVIRVNLLKQTVVVSVGIGQWEVSMDEVLPA
jgi:DNA mismatch repair protein MutS2